MDNPLTGVMLGLAAAMLQLAAPADHLRGEVFAHDGIRVTAATVTLTCGTWERQTQTDTDGGFVFEGVPAVECSMRVQAPGDAMGGVDERVPATRGQPMAVILPRPVRRPAPGSDNTASTIDLTAPVESTRVTTPLLSLGLQGGGIWSTTGGAGSRGGFTAVPPRLDMPGVLPSDNEQGWTAGVRVWRAGPWGTLFTGTARARRQLGPTTLLSDVTDTPPPSAGSWSMLTDPTRSAVIWDLRLGVEKSFGVGAANITLFGEVYGSMQPRLDQGRVPATVTGAPGNLRSGRAARGGVKIGF